MGYELNIFRKENWSSNEQSNITIEEWLRYADSDNELSKSSEENEYEWTAYPDADEVGRPWFKFNDGYIRSKNPNFLVIKKMLEIAKELKAKVQGEEGELYDESFLDVFQ